MALLTHFPAVLFFQCLNTKNKNAWRKVLVYLRRDGRALVERDAEKEIYIVWNYDGYWTEVHTFAGGHTARCNEYEFTLGAKSCANEKAKVVAKRIESFGYRFKK